MTAIIIATAAIIVLAGWAALKAHRDRVVREAALVAIQSMDRDERVRRYRATAQANDALWSGHH